MTLLLVWQGMGIGRFDSTEEYVADFWGRSVFYSTLAAGML